MLKEKFFRNIILGVIFGAAISVFGSSMNASAVAIDVSAAEDLIPYFTSGGEVRLADNISLSSNTSILKDLTIDLNGHTLNMANKTLVPAAHLTVMDSSDGKTGKITSTAAFTIQIGSSTTTGALTLESGTIDCHGSYCIRNFGDFTMNGGVVTGAAFVVYNQGNFVLNGGTVTATTGMVVRGSANGSLFTMNGGKVATLGNAAAVNLGTAGSKFVMNGGEIEALWVNADHTKAGNGVTAFKDTEFIMNGGSITATGNAVSGNGSGPESGNADGSNAKFSINGGTITSTLATGIYAPQLNGVNTITGGTIKGITGIEIRAGKLTVTGGTILGTGDYEVTNNANGLTTKGAAISVAQHTSQQPIEVYISGGEFDAYAPISSANPMDYTQEVIDRIDISIVGGGYIGEDYDDVIDNVENGYIELDRTTGGFIVTLPREDEPEEEKDPNILVPDTGEFTMTQDERVGSDSLIQILLVVVLGFVARFAVRVRAYRQRLSAQK